MMRTVSLSRKWAAPTLFSTTRVTERTRDGAPMYRVTIAGFDHQEPTIEFIDYESATRYAGVLLAMHCPSGRDGRKSRGSVSKAQRSVGSAPENSQDRRRGRQRPHKAENRRPN